MTSDEGFTSTTGGELQRRGAIDLARSASLALVVVAHLTMVVLDRGPNGSLRGVNLFELYPRFEWLTMLSPMPLFFVASGWANVRSTRSSRTRRASILVVLATVVAVCWSIASLVERAVTSHHGIVADGSRIATQPLWFLTAWVPFTVFADVLTRASRRIIPVVAACLLVMTVTDLVRFVGGAPRWVGYPGFFAAWAVPWVMGAWWRQRHDEGGVDERRAGLTIGLLAIAMGSLLVAFLGYHAALIDAVPGHRSNTTPPTLFTAVASLIQFGLFLIVARRLDGIARRHVRAVRTLEALAPGLYVWHLTALSLWGALLAAGLWAPDRLTLAWWLTRPAWFAAVIGVSIVFSLATRRALATMQATRQSAEVRTGVVIASTAAATVAFGLTGLFGPDTSVMATAIAILALAASAGFLMSPRQTAA